MFCLYNIMYGWSVNHELKGLIRRLGGTSAWVSCSSASSFMVSSYDGVLRDNAHVGRFSLIGTWYSSTTLVLGQWVAEKVGELCNPRQSLYRKGYLEARCHILLRV
jgi:hypothetical protein